MATAILLHFRSSILAVWKVVITTMDISRLGSGQASVKMPGAQIIDLDSDSDNDIADALVTAQRVGISGVNELEALDVLEESADEEDADSTTWDEVESLFEDTLEEMGDESLYDAGESPETTMSMTR